jgi:HEPN domain-containing protein
MNTQQRLEHVANRYRQQGYKVILDPGPDDLPAFARDFKVEILATRPDGGVLVSAKGSSFEFENNPDLSRYADFIENQPGWRYDVFVLGPPPPVPGPSEVADASEEEISRALADSERLLEAGFRPQAITSAWAALESAMRHKLRAMGDDAGWGTSPGTMLNELVSSGVLSRGEFRDLEGISRARNMIVHGFSAPETGHGAVTFVSDIARRLLAESKQAAPAQ